MVYKSFFGGKNFALKDLSLEIESGQVFGILGPNAAGKTTLISILSTLLIPDRGTVKILGLDALKDTNKIRERINMTSGSPNLPWSLTVYECLRFFSMAYGMSNKSKIEELIEMFDLSQYRNVEFEELSTGNKQKLSLAKAFINDPELVFLDEPTTGLDPDVARRIRKKILEIHEEYNITTVLTTHYMSEAEQLCDKIAFLNHGRIVATGTQKELKKIIGARDKIIIELSSGVKLPKLSVEGVIGVDLKGERLTILVDDAEKRIKDVLNLLSPVYRYIKKISMEEANLEDVFVELAKRD